VSHISTWSCDISDRYSEHKNTRFVNTEQRTFYYNAGDNLEFTNSLYGYNDTTVYYGITYYNKFYILRATAGTPWSYSNSIFNPGPFPGPINNPMKTIYIYENTHLYQQVAGILTPLQLYNDTLVLTLESGYDYWVTRYYVRPDNTGLIWAENPIQILVNNPVIGDAQSYIPPAITPPSVAVPNRKSIPLSRGVNINTAGTITTTTASLDYELSTGFKYDDITNTIGVFDGDYNNLTNKPDATISLNDTNSSNYTKRIETELRRSRKASRVRWSLQVCM
jgi:hypothetical protein